MAEDSTGENRPHGSLAERFAALWQARGGSDNAPDVVSFLDGYPDATIDERVAVFLVDRKERRRAGLDWPEIRNLGASADLALARLLALGGFEDASNSEALTVEIGDSPDQPETPEMVWTPVEGPVARDLLVTLRDREPDFLPAEDETRSGLAETRTADGRLGDHRSTDGYSSLLFELSETPAADAEPSDPAIGLGIHTRFRIEDRLGTGGMGVVFRAFDHQRGEAVALKTMRRIDPVALYRFKQEFRGLTDLSHPNLVNLHELIAVGEVWFFTMELVPGVNFIDYIRQTETPCEGAPNRFPPTEGLHVEALARLRLALRQLAEGVSALHGAGKLHRDIKPPNVLVTPESRVVLLDFGLSADLERSGLLPAIGERVVGTVAYMSPEQSTGQTLARATDWYSVGVILYEALTGVLPIDGTPNEVLDAKVRVDPPPPGEIAAGVPDDLNALCVDLLQRDPLARPSGPEILARLAADQEPATPGVGGPRRADGQLLGRDRHREALDAALTEVKAGQSVLMFVSGRPGSGKTALIQAFLRHLQDEEDGAVVLSGRCFERESVPFKALDSVIDELSRYLMPRPADEVNALLPRDVALLARMFPVLQRVEAIASASRRRANASDQQELRRRALAALRELLTAIGREGPLILVIDDLQWGDPENADLIADLLRPPDAPVMLLIGAYRTDDAEESPLIRALLRPSASGPKRRELSVGALTSVESRDLALALLGRHDAAARAEAHVIARESQGNPFFIDELVKHIRSVGGLPVGGQAAGRIVLDEVLWGRVTRLSEEARTLLEVVAVSGRPVSLVDACHAAGLGLAGRAAAASLKAARLVRGTVRPNRDEVETYHDWVRETVVAHLPADLIKAHHLRLAQVLEAGGRADAETLAVHYEQGDRPDLAAENYAKAGDRSVAALAFAHAATLYRRALRLRPAHPGDPFDANRLRTRLANALANAGRGREAADEYLKTAETADAAEALDLKRRAALQLLISGHVDDGFRLLGAVLRTRGMSMPGTPTGALLALLGRRLWLRIRGLGFRPRDASQVSAEGLALIDLCWSAGAGLSLIDPIRGADFQSRGLLLALRAGEPYRVARALTLEASTVALGGLPSAPRVSLLLAKAEAIARPLDLPHIDALLALSRGVAALMTGRWKDACRAFARAEPILRERCTAVAWELDTVHNLWLWALAFLGDLTELRRLWRIFIDEARKRGDLYAVTTMSTYYMALLRLADDDPAQAMVETEAVIGSWSRRGYHVQHASALRARANVALYRGEAELAWEEVKGDWPDYRRSLLPRVQWLRVQMTELRARSALAAADVTTNSSRLIRLAENDAESLRREGVGWALAHASMIRAGIAARRGDGKASTAFLHDAVGRYDAAEMHLHASVARRCAGASIGGESGHWLVDQIDHALTCQGVRDPLAFAGMFAPWSADLRGKAVLSGGR